MGTDDGVWAVVVTAGAKYIGALQPSGKYRDQAGMSPASAMQEVMTTGWIRMEPVYEFNSMIIPQQTPHGLAMGRNIGAFPLGLNSHPHTIRVKPTDIWLFADMKEEDQFKYKKLVESANQMARESRMRDAGLVSASPALPNIPGGNTGRA